MNTQDILNGGIQNKMGYYCFKSVTLIYLKLLQQNSLFQLSRIKLPFKPLDLYYWMFTHNLFDIFSITFVEEV